MIYREPVVHEIPLITQPTLFIMGADDHNAPGRPNAPEALRPKMGQNAELAKALAAKMPNARAEVIPDTGHLVFLEAPDEVQRADARLSRPMIQSRCERQGPSSRSLPRRRHQFLKHTNHLTSDGGASDDANDDGASAASPSDADASGAMPVVPPANLFGFEMIDLAFCNERGLRAIARRRRKALRCLDRRQRRRIRAGGKRRRPQQPKTEFQKFPTFHDISFSHDQWTKESFAASR